MDTDSLIASLGALHLPSLHPRSPAGTPPPRFPLFTTLPLELRQKIYSHALPDHGTITLEAQILISDPSFGLYLTFALPPLSPAHFTLPSGPKINEPRLKYNRMLSLLLASHEIREWYLSQHPITLPIARGGKTEFQIQHSSERGRNTEGRLHISPLEILEIINIRSLLMTPAFHLAIARSYRLQDWILKIERLVIPVLAFVPSRENRRRVGAQEGEEKTGFERLEMFLVKCMSLKEVRATMWEGFREAYLENEERAGRESSDNLIAGMEGHVTVVERELERWKSEVDGNYEVPRFAVAL